MTTWAVFTARSSWAGRQVDWVWSLQPVASPARHDARQIQITTQLSSDYLGQLSNNYFRIICSKWRRTGGEACSDRAPGSDWNPSAIGSLQLSHQSDRLNFKLHCLKCDQSQTSDIVLWPYIVSKPIMMQKYMS